MSSHGMLDIVLSHILRVVTPLQEDWQLRFATINDLRKIVESVESLRGTTVEPFGLFVSNLFTRWGDLDISIELSNGGSRNLEFIPNARVPILKFNWQGVSCDISINNLPGQMKSKILLWINRIDYRFRDMVLLVKEWAKAHNINNSQTGTFNTYSLCLLVIFHFQTCVPAILPPLKEIYPGNMVDDLRGVRADAENLIADTCDANIKRFISNTARSINRNSVAELFVEFVIKFSQMDLWAPQLGICPYTGTWEQIGNNTAWLRKTYAIFVEDPFEQPQNTTRSVNALQLKRISETFLKTYSLLTSQNQNQDSLLQELAPMHIVRCIRPSIRNYGGGYFQPTQPQLPRAVHQQLPLERHFQYDGQGTSSNPNS